MKIGDRVIAYKIIGKIFPQLTKWHTDGKLVGINLKTNEIRIKDYDGNGEFIYPNECFIFYPARFFGLSGRYWSNKEGLEKYIAEKERKFKEECKQRDIKKGWKFNE